MAEPSKFSLWASLSVAISTTTLLGLLMAVGYFEHQAYVGTLGAPSLLLESTALQLTWNGVSNVVLKLLTPSELPRFFLLALGWAALALFSLLQILIAWKCVEQFQDSLLKKTWKTSSWVRFPFLALAPFAGYLLILGFFKLATLPLKKAEELGQQRAQDTQKQAKKSLHLQFEVDGKVLARGVPLARGETHFSVLETDTQQVITLPLEGLVVRSSPRLDPSRDSKHPSH